MRVDLGPRYTISSLISPHIWVLTTTCLSTNYRIDSRMTSSDILDPKLVQLFTLKTYVIADGTDSDVLLDTKIRHRPYLWNYVTVGLPVGSYRVRFDVIVAENVDLNVGLHVDVDSIVTTPGECRGM